MIRSKPPQAHFATPCFPITSAFSCNLWVGKDKALGVDCLTMSNIKLFLDGADRDSMVEMAKNSAVHGFTTNPTLMRKSGVSDYRKFCREILPELCGKPVSFEVFADDFPTMEKQAREIGTWGSNVYVKIPAINSKGESAAGLVKTLSQAGIPLNVTAVFTLEQSWEMTRSLKGGAPSILSVFAGRIADSGRDPLPTMLASAEMCRDAGPQVELLWASTREAYNILQAEQVGCKIITVPMDVLKKALGFGKKTPWDLSLETVRTFVEDSKAAGFQL